MTDHAARPAPDALEPIEVFDPPSLATAPVAQLARIREGAEAFRRVVLDSGEVDQFAARSLVTLPYPRRYGLYEACVIPVPYIWFTNRVFVVRWTDAQGVLRTLLAEPTDHALGGETPYYKLARRDVRRVGAWLEHRMVEYHTHVTAVLASLGIARDEVDYLSFDHLHTQDVRRIVGTTVPAPDIGHRDAPVEPAFPNAKLIVQRDELEHVNHGIHPFQQRFFQPTDRYSTLREENMLIVEGDALVGPGVAIMRTAGHTLGNHTLVVNVPGRGLVTSSENGISVESYEPSRSRIPGVRRWARRWDYEVVMNFNTPEYASFQYNSMVKEKLVADRNPDAPQWPQVFPSSELTSHPLAPGIRPTFEYGDVTWGAVRPAGRSQRPAPAREDVVVNAEQE